MSRFQEVKVRTFDLEIGMYVSRLDKEWTETSYPLQGFLIQNDAQIQKLLDECEYVYIDTNKGGFSVKTSETSAPSQPKVIVEPQKKNKTNTPVPEKHLSLHLAKKPLFNLKGLFNILNKEQADDGRAHPHQLKDIVTLKVPTTTIKPPKKLVRFDQEINFAKQAHTVALELLDDFSTQVKEGETINMLVAEHAIHDCMLSALRSPDALLLASHLHKKHRAIWEHSMRVCVLAINLGRHLNVTDDDLTILGLCGMLHDIGALLISKEMLAAAENKIELMESHTILGRDILLSCAGDFAETVAEVAYSHHEYLNGTGFPRGLKNEQISPYARIITLIDLYVGLTTDSPKKKGLTHYEAILELLNQTDTHLDDVLVNSFNLCIGTYPVGCFVEMNTGEVGIVVEANSEEKLKPKIILITTPDKQTRPKHLIDLANLQGKETLYAIAAIVRPEKYGIET